MQEGLGGGLRNLQANKGHRTERVWHGLRIRDVLYRCPLIDKLLYVLKPDTRCKLRLVLNAVNASVSSVVMGGCFLFIYCSRLKKRIPENKMSYCSPPPTPLWYLQQSLFIFPCEMTFPKLCFVLIPVSSFNTKYCTFPYVKIRF